MGVKEWGDKPSVFTDRSMMNSLNIRSAQGAEGFPALRRRRGGNRSEREFHKRERRVGSWFCDVSNRVHAEAMAKDGIIIGRLRIRGGLN